MRQNYLVTPETFYKRKAGEIIYGYAIQPGCCFEMVELDKEKSDWKFDSIEYFPSCDEMHEITEIEYLRLKEECERLRAWRYTCS